jgi:hypothetical protein
MSTTVLSANVVSEGMLERVRVLDLGSHGSGPFCARLLAAYGADVIKVELPAVGGPAFGPSLYYFLQGDGVHPIIPEITGIACHYVVQRQVVRDQHLPDSIQSLDFPNKGASQHL